MRVAFVFPGQGSQEVGMGRALCEAHPAARAAFDEADKALGDPRALSQLCFEGPLEELTQTANTQPAILTTSVAAFRALHARMESSGRARDVAMMAGHSLGEYSALVCAGALSLADTVRLVRLRGRAMQDAVPAGVGAMAAVMGVDADTLTSLCEAVSRETSRVVSPANFNAPGQIVVAGHAEAVEALSKRVGDHRGRAIPLKVSAPFHCALMAPAADVLRDALRALDVGAFRAPVVSNVDASPYSDADTLRDVLFRQVAGSVRWEQSVRRMIADGVTTFVELGPGKVLAGLIRRVDKTVAVHSVSDPVSLDATANALCA